MKQFYSYLFVLPIVLSPLLARAQQPQVFTLDQCIEYALTNSISAKNAEIDQQIAKARVNETIGLGLPQIEGTGSIQHNQKLRRFFTTYNPGGGFIDLSGVPGIQAGDVVAAQNFFQLKSSGDLGVTVNQLIFNGSYLVGLQASNAYKDLSVKTANQTKEQIIQQVTKAYYTVVINKERIDLFSSNIARVDSLLRSTKALNVNGFTESIDVDRLQVTLNNLLAERDKFLNLNKLGIELLKFQMNYPMDQAIDVSGKIQDVQVGESVTAPAEWDFKKRPDYQVLEANRKLQALNVKNQYAKALPSIVAFANMGYASQSPNVGGLFKTNSKISDEGGVGPDKWYGYSMFGLTMNIPIFSGLQRTFKLQQEKLRLVQIDNSFKQLKSGIDFETKQTTINFENALKTLAIQKENMELAANVARVTKIKYQQGVGTNLEVIDAENGLRNAQVNFYSALFDAMISKVDLDKAYGRLLPAYTQQTKN